MPGKVFEYLAARKPVLCVGPAGSDADDILREASAGQILPYDDYALMMSTLEHLAQQWRQNPDLDLRDTTPAQYSRRGQAAQLAKLVRALSKR
ncbi:MAG: hypothetical protein EOO57_23075 [Hymenobacter sp.]|nr:MAG: hypothetical protein EOO57_23075 [Hymenobacter sp.]